VDGSGQNRGGSIAGPAPADAFARSLCPGFAEQVGSDRWFLSQLIEKSRSTIEKEGGIRKLLASFINENPDVVDASFVDGKGFLRQIEPSEYKNLENADISKRDHVIAMLQTRMPVFSSGFPHSRLSGRGSGPPLVRPAGKTSSAPSVPSYAPSC